MSEPENIIPIVPIAPDPERGDSSTGDVASGQVGTPKVGGVSPTVTPHKHFPTLLLLLVPVLVIIAVIAIYILLQARTMYQQTIVVPSPSPSPTPIASIDPTETWETYVDRNNQFTFKYPSEWKLTANKIGIELVYDDLTQEKVLYPGDTTEYARYWVEISNPSLKQTLPAKVEDVLIDEYPAKKYLQGSAPSSGLNTNILLTMDDKQYLFSYSAMAHEETHLKYISIFDQILTTFKFTD